MRTINNSFPKCLHEFKLTFCGIFFKANEHVSILYDNIIYLRLVLDIDNVQTYQISNLTFGKPLFISDD